MDEKNLEGKRWFIAFAAVIMQLCLGGIYAWSVFKKPLMEAHGWGETSIQVTFMICIGVIGLAAAFGGTLVDKKGPKFVASIGGILYGLGMMIAGLADQLGSIWLLYLGFGLVAGLGNGFCYITPIATLIRWFPDKRGLVTGLAVMGFGGGAFFMGIIAPKIVISMGTATTFYIWGEISLVLTVAAGQFYKNPPKEWLPAGFAPKTGKAQVTESRSFNEAVRSPQWWVLWSMLFLNISAGLGLISQLSPMAQDLIKEITQDISAKELAVAGGGVVALASIFNGLGRLFWAGISDAVGRKNVFLTMFATQAVLYIILPQIHNQLIFSVIACYLLACYGGGFATMPALAADSFGPAHIGKVYGIMLTAWGAAGIAGPLVFAQIKSMAVFVAAGLLVVGFLLALSLKRQKPKEVVVGGVPLMASAPQEAGWGVGSLGGI